MSARFAFVIVCAIGCSSTPGAPAPTQGSGEWPEVDCNALFSVEVIARACGSGAGSMDIHDEPHVYPATVDDPRLISYCDRRFNVAGDREHLVGIAVHGYETPAVLEQFRAQRRERSGYDPVTVLHQGSRRDLEVAVGRVLVMLMEAAPPGTTPLCSDHGLEMIAASMRAELTKPVPAANGSASR